MDIYRCVLSSPRTNHSPSPWPMDFHHLLPFKVMTLADGHPTCMRSRISVVAEILEGRFFGGLIWGGMPANRAVSWFPDSCPVRWLNQIRTCSSTVIIQDTVGVGFIGSQRWYIPEDRIVVFRMWIWFWSKSLCLLQLVQQIEVELVYAHPVENGTWPTAKRYLKLNRLKSVFVIHGFPCFANIGALCISSMYCLFRWDRNLDYGTWTTMGFSAPEKTNLNPWTASFQLFIFGEVLQLCLSYEVVHVKSIRILSIQKPRETGKC